MTEPFLLPAGSRVVHVGPHKTGTTAVQYAFHQGRDALAAQGVHYVGTGPQAYEQALGLTGLPGQMGGPRGTGADWLDLVAEVRAAGDQRVVMSSESFANARRAHIERLAADLDPERVQVVRMVRRYDRMLPSQWQQLVSAGEVQGYRAYLDAVLRDPDHRFWRRHGFVPLTERWLDVVGRDHLVVVVVDEHDRGWLLRVFERFLGLRGDTLDTAQVHDNRSLTRGEVEMLRAMNLIRTTSGWGPETHYRFVRWGVSVGLRGLPADPHGGRISLPPDLLDAVADITARDLKALDELGVRVVGSTRWLTPEPSPRDPRGLGVRPTVGLASAEAAAGAVLDRVGEVPRARLSAKGRPPVLPPSAARRRPGRLPPPEPLGRGGTLVVRAGDPASEGLVDGLGISELEGGRVPWRTRVVVGDPRTATRRTHAVLVLVPPYQSLLHGWQGHLLTGGRDELPAWVHGQSRGGSAAIVRATAERFGAERVTVVLADVEAPDELAACVEGLAGLPRGRLRRGPAGRTVLAWPELELVRRLYAGTWPPERLRRHVARGLVPWLLAGAAPRPRTSPLPPMAHAWARGEAEALAAALTATGVRTVGRQGRWGPPGPLVTQDPRLGSATVARALSGIIARTDPRKPRASAPR